MVYFKWFEQINNSNNEISVRYKAIIKYFYRPIHILFYIGYINI